ncbi:START domain-containing protein 10-like isoform X2 [Macrosteles quadrilineatus]|uniref:START domain-containing protein 10-like isoform X2 n=1 Tax=Macrosteles quadrilineatus TaxID=74068 RepID=UPI0023E24598|nr:START domain-containing protein 10-like isoform X2 [Macrosteles quadrilineatus]XP_054261412.1 START domain-containing protein 10-like isoform X2 [Macrosteles quadrilineatus]
MEVGQVKVAEDKDFENLKYLLDNHTGWKLDYTKTTIKVWTKNVSNTNFKMVKVKAEFTDINAELLYDVLHDPEYRKVWDQHMIEAKDIGCLNPNNDVGYYSMSCPTPLGNRDFVLQRSWLDLGNEKYILNHSVYHCQHPPRQGFIRATSYLTGYLVRSYPNIPGCELGYISQTDPQGTLPPWLVNRVTQIFGPKVNCHKSKMQLASRNLPPLMYVSAKKLTSLPLPLGQFADQRPAESQQRLRQLESMSQPVVQTLA